MGIYRDANDTNDANDANDARRREGRLFDDERTDDFGFLYSAHPSRRFYYEYDTRRERSILPRDVYDRLTVKP